MKSKALDSLAWAIRVFCIDHKLKMVNEFRFHPVRRWRLDFAIPELKIGIEFQGGVFMKKSGHSNFKGQTRDSEKQNEAQKMGWMILTYTASNAKNVSEDLKQILTNKKTA